MKVVTKYRCEVCGTLYDVKEVAEFCEAYVLPPCPVKSGDAVEVKERYDEPQLDKVVSVEIGPSPAVSMGMKPIKSLADYEDFMTRVSSLGAIATHQWVVTLENDHQWSKNDDDFGKRCTVSMLRPPGGGDDDWFDSRG